MLGGSLAALDELSLPSGKSWGAEMDTAMNAVEKLLTDQVPAAKDTLMKVGCGETRAESFFW